MSEQEKLQQRPWSALNAYKAPVKVEYANASELVLLVKENIISRAEARALLGLE
jgi:hypothetical protein